MTPPEAWSRYTDAESKVSWYAPCEPKKIANPGTFYSVTYESRHGRLTYQLTVAKTQTMHEGTPWLFLDSAEKAAFKVFQRGKIAYAAKPIMHVQYQQMLGRMMGILTDRVAIGRLDLAGEGLAVWLSVTGPEEEVSEMTIKFASSLDFGHSESDSKRVDTASVDKPLSATTPGGPNIKVPNIKLPEPKRPTIPSIKRPDFPAMPRPNALSQARSRPTFPNRSGRTIQTPREARSASNRDPETRLPPIPKAKSPSGPTTQPRPKPAAPTNPAMNSRPGPTIRTRPTPTTPPQPKPSTQPRPKPMVPPLPNPITQTYPSGVAPKPSELGNQPRPNPSVQTPGKQKWHLTSDAAAPASRPFGEAFPVSFINRRDSVVHLHWIDRNGKRKSYGEIDSGDSKRMRTKRGAVWLITDESDRSLGYFSIRDRSSLAEIPENAK